MEQIPLNVTDEEIESYFYPCVTRRYGKYDPKWLLKKYRFRSKIRYSRWKKKIKQLIKPGTKILNDNPIKAEKYESSWEQFKYDVILSPGFRTRPYEWRKEGFMANHRGIHQIFMLYLYRMIKLLKPQSVLEVGFGNGINLLALSTYFPGISFAGIEITNQGFQDACAAAKEDKLPEAIVAFSPVPITEQGAHKKINFIRGDAQDLPFDDSSYDLVFTLQALEQMNDIIDKVMSEISRVSKKNVAMFEAFKDWNNKGLRRDYILDANYFRVSLAELERYSLKPVFVNNDLPSKIKMNVGLVVCETMK